MDARGNIYRSGAPGAIPAADVERLKTARHSALAADVERRLDLLERGVEPEKRTPVLYLDIDGTVRHGKDELGRFVNDAADVHVFEGVADLLGRYKALGWRIVGISNQGGIALGLLSMQVCAEAMMETQRQAGDAFDKIAWCSHHPSADNPEMAVCWCRKPKAGLVIETALALADRYRGEIYPPHLALLVGDRPEDATCAEAASVPFMDASAWRSGEHLANIAS
jgi:D-glycero-D-manno-heptose 1,7-bisphosphate phosphatase